MTVKQRDHQGKPLSYEVEIGPRYGDLTNYETQNVMWTHDRIGFIPGAIILWDPEKQVESTIHCRREEMQAIEKVLNILSKVGVLS